MTAQEVRSRLDYNSNDPEYLSLAAMLKLEPDEVVFEALFPVAIHSQSVGPAYPAAVLLWRRRPGCPLSCDDAIRALLDDWDISIEEAPFYVISQFGVDGVTEAISRVRQTGLGDWQTRQLDTVAYWLKIWVDWKVGENEANS